MASPTICFIQYKVSFKTVMIRISGLKNEQRSDQISVNPGLICSHHAFFKHSGSGDLFDHPLRNSMSVKRKCFSGHHILYRNVSGIMTKRPPNTVICQATTAALSLSIYFFNIVNYTSSKKLPQSVKFNVFFRIKMYAYSGKGIGGRSL